MLVLTYTEDALADLRKYGKGDMYERWREVAPYHMQRREEDRWEVMNRDYETICTVEAPIEKVHQVWMKGHKDAGTHYPESGGVMLYRGYGHEPFQGVLAFREYMNRMHTLFSIPQYEGD